MNVCLYVRPLCIPKRLDRFRCNFSCVFLDNLDSHLEPVGLIRGDAKIGILRFIIIYFLFIYYLLFTLRWTFLFINICYCYRRNNN